MLESLPIPTNVFERFSERKVKILPGFFGEVLVVKFGADFFQFRFGEPVCLEIGETPPRRPKRGFEPQCLVK